MHAAIVFPGQGSQFAGMADVWITHDASREVQSPENYAVQIGIKPQPSAQTITVATSFSDKVVKSWGLTVAA